MPSSTVRATELATFSFCQRAWYYARTGVVHDHPDVIRWGTQWHRSVERHTRRSIVYIRLGILLLLCGIIVSLFNPLMN
jgi:hypothetical protein